MESRDPKSTESAEANSGTESKDPKSTATSDETLHDLEKSEDTSKQSDSQKEDSTPGAVPSPDGEIQGERGSKDDAGPM